MPKSRNESTPYSLGYCMPAEWETHDATWLGWPHELTDWPGKFAPIPWAFAEIGRHLSQVERVYLLVENREAESRVRTILKKSGANLAAVDFFRVPTDRGWMRDFGPICVKNSPGEVAYTQLAFQRLGQIRQLQKRRASRRQSEQEAQTPPLATHSQRPPHRA